MNQDRHQIHVWISGKVQGVGYRLWAQRQAIELGLVGWVKNLPDGRVEAVFAGKKEVVEEMVELCHSGPISAQVTDIMTKIEDCQNFASFSLNY